MSDQVPQQDSLEALQALAAALSRLRFYPPDHPSCSAAIETLAARLETVLSREEEWRLAVIGSRIVAGGAAVDERPERFQAVTESLRSCGVDTIAFRRGLERAEVRRLLTLLAEYPRDKAAAAPFSELLASQGIRRIAAGRLTLGDPGETKGREAALEQVGSGASEIYEGAVGFIRETIVGAQLGRKISVREAEEFVQSMIHQLTLERSPYLILTTLKSHHAYTFTHIVNVCILTLVQLEALGATPQMLREFGLASMLHDIGKSLVPKEILSKPGRLTPDEFAMIQRHPIDGALMLRQTPSVPELAMVVAFEHHMRHDQHGYPRVRRRRSLHPCSLMTNIADTYDAMRSRRSYQAEQPPERVARWISERAGSDFHPLLAQAFLQVMGAYPPGTRVLLDSGEEAIAIRVNPRYPSRPVVRLLRDSRGSFVRRLEVVDLSEKERNGKRFARSIVRSILSGGGRQDQATGDA
ncbi:MAG: HD-GYP domain-containing protein [Acidobacteriota bacterium]